MAEILSPGVFIEEVPSSVQVVTPVSTSNMGIVGFTPKGPTNDPTLVTSFEQFTSKFGDIVKESFMGLSMAAYFSNGGRRAFIVRVVPSDAVSADANVRSATVEQETNTGDGTTALVSEASLVTSLLKVNAGVSPVVGDTVSFQWRGTGTSVTTENTKQRDGTTNLQTSTNAGAIYYEGILDPANKPAFHEKMHVVEPGTVTFNFNDSTGAVTLSVTSTTDVATAASAGNSVILDHRSGRFALVTNGVPTAVVNITADYDPAFGDQGDRATATVTGGGGPNGEIYILVDSVGVAGNLWSVEIVDTTGTISQPLTAQFATGTTNQIQVLLATDGLGVLDATGNTAILVAAAIDGLAGVSASEQGTGATAVAAAEGPTFFSGGRDSLPYFEITDDGAGVLNSGVGITAPGSITYTTGAYSFTMNSSVTINSSVGTGGVVTTTYSAVAHDQSPILCNYEIDAWTSNPISAGAWGNDLRLQVLPNDDYYTASSATYGRFNVNVQLVDVNGNYVTQETFEELVFDDPLDADFWADVLNDLSDLVTIVEPGADEPPLQLNGIARTNILAGGDESASGQALTGTLSDGPIATRSVTITYTDTSLVTRTITDDGAGNLTGDVDAAGTNTINYVSGAIDVTLVNPVDGGTLVTATYASAPAETAHNEVFGDTTKGYTVGSDGTFTSSTYGRNQFSSPTLDPLNQGIYALNLVDELMQVVVPDFAGDVTITGDMIDYADARALQPSGADRFLILTVPQGSDSQEAVDFLQFQLGRNTIHAAMYWPWIRVADPLTDGRPLTIPPMGHIAGIYARTDATRNVGKSPGGTVDGKLNFLLGLESESTLGERDYVYQRKINPLINSPATGLAVWGVRTIYPVGQSEWRYISARRLFNFLEKSIFNATHWIVFENNGPGLWSRISAQLNGFLTALFNEGLFAGRSPSEAFLVVVDSSNNTPESLALGQVIIDVAVAPNKPAEFVRFRFTQKTLS